MIRTLSTVLFLLGSWAVHGQSLGDMAVSIDDDFITWRTSHSTNSKTGTRTMSDDVFKTSPDSVVWITDGGKSVYRLHIDSKHQTWSDINDDGTQTYDLVWKNIPGTIAFQKSNGNTSITTIFNKANVNAAPFVYEVSETIKN